jgi:hypothetical protein
MNFVAVVGVVGVEEPDQERLKQLHGNDYDCTHQLVAVAAIVGTEEYWTGYHRDDSSRNRRMGEVECNRRLCTEGVGGNYYRRQWEDDEREWEAKTLHAWVVGACCDMLT